MIAITDFVDRVSPDILGAPNKLITECIRDVIIRFCAETWVLQRGFGATVSSINTALNNAATISLTGITDLEEVKPIGVISLLINDYEYQMKMLKVVNHIDTIADNTTIKYFYFDDSSSYDIIICPMTIGDIINAVFAVTPTLDATYVDTILYDTWLEALVAGSKAKLLLMPKKSWTDPQLANLYMKEYRTGVNNARRQSRKEFTKARTSVNPRSDEVWQ